jgi:hypothetical protein
MFAVNTVWKEPLFWGVLSFQTWGNVGKIDFLIIVTDVFTLNSEFTGIGNGMLLWIKRREYLKKKNVH